MFLWVLLILIDCLIVGGISELWIRGFIPVKNIKWCIDSELGNRYAPNQKSCGHVQKGYHNVFVTNSLGFHDIERTRAKAKGVFRIHIYGDSMTANPCVFTDETISAFLEKYLNAAALPIRFEVLNMGPGDDSTSAQILAFEKIGVYFEPDLVICYFMADFADNLLEIHKRKYSAYHRITASGELVYVPPLPKDTPIFFERFKRTSLLYRLLANKFLESKVYHDYLRIYNQLSYAVERNNSRQNYEHINDYRKYRKKILTRKGWPLTLKLIEHFRDKVEENNAQFLVVDGREFSDNNVSPVYSNKDFEAFCTEKGINYIPGYKELFRLQSSGNSEEHFFVDQHPTALANEKISLFLLEEIKRFLFTDNIVQQ